MTWMRSATIGATVLFLFGGLVCSKVTGPEDPKGTITVFVYFEDQSIPGKQVELVETGDSLKTDAHGLAVFKVSPGAYTVRVYDINQGGPMLRFVDVAVEVRGETLNTVKVFDCLPCV